MGCDIHYVVEQKHAHRWIGVYASDVIVYKKRAQASERFYRFFTEIAGVRGESATQIEPRGMPGDASELALYMAQDWDGDGHTHSFLSVAEFITSYKRANEAAVGRQEPLDAEDLLAIYDDDAVERRVVFWFDN